MKKVKFIMEDQYLSTLSLKINKFIEEGGYDLIDVRISQVSLYSGVVAIVIYDDRSDGLGLRRLNG